MRYRRTRIPGAAYFLPVNLAPNEKAIPSLITGEGQFSDRCGDGPEKRCGIIGKHDYSTTWIQQ